MCLYRLAPPTLMESRLLVREEQPRWSGDVQGRVRIFKFLFPSRKRAHKHPISWVGLLSGRLPVDTPPDRRRLSCVVWYVDGFFCTDFVNILKVAVITIPAVFVLSGDKLGRFRSPRARFDKVRVFVNDNSLLFNPFDIHVGSFLPLLEVR